ncbi:MAG: TOBE domain-containing protein [Halodesulfurarchaeum sp.]
MRSIGEPFLGIDGARVDERDVRALSAIAEYGSMHRAAAELGRSYSRLQKRITELEDTLGPLVERTRGGEGGGGSTLTPTARDLLARFDRLRAEFSGLARAEESVFPGTVVDREGLLGTIETPAGPVRGIVPPDADTVQVSIRSDAVGVTTPDDAPKPTATSVRNQFEGTVTNIDAQSGLAHVAVDVGADTPLVALLTQTSLETLDLAVGDPVVASFKATATRAVGTHEGES